MSADESKYKSKKKNKRKSSNESEDSSHEEKTKRKYTKNIKKDLHKVACISVKFIENDIKSPNYHLNQTVGVAVLSEIIGFGDLITKEEVRYY